MFWEIDDFMCLIPPSHLNDHFAVDRPLDTSCNASLACESRKNTGINSRPDLLLLHNLCDFLQLRPVGADEQEPVFLALFSGGFVVFAAGQSEQQFLEAGNMIFHSKGFVGAGFAGSPAARLVSEPSIHVQIRQPPRYQ